ncbi:hypothetical protein A9P82_11485 [Arachidicoccus ginsenosidimutans]|uniref:hypothetical protein n=1 Tax=Arachidicoccus sp. BS20 TaxID=1850526 RepID=UPI0007F14671|nr:hypothetical protein [Arachidicoccus sp. BS20]ANI89853.1 hypothetical protein A9P82_11485 [Arachidicoccus sp. BS20]
MESNDRFREQQRKRYANMRAIKDVVMAIIILGVGLMMFFGKKFLYTRAFFQEKDPVILYIFGSLCLLYGGFRMYMAIKRNY